MLTLRQVQHENLQKAAWSAYRKKLLAHYEKFAPELYRIAGKEQFGLFLDYGMEKALHIGLNLRGPMRLLLDIMCIIGQDFDVDPQYRPLWPKEDPAKNPMPFAQHLQKAFGEYLQQCVGLKDKAILAHALNRLTSTSLEAETPFRNWVHKHFKVIYPQRLTYMGEQNLRDFLNACEATATNAQIKSHSGRQLVVVLASAFGSNFLSNPLYPWVVKRLQADAPEEKRVEKTKSALRLYVSQMLTNLEKKT